MVCVLGDKSQSVDVASNVTLWQGCNRDIVQAVPSTRLCVEPAIYHVPELAAVKGLASIVGGVVILETMMPNMALVTLAPAQYLQNQAPATKVSRSGATPQRSV